MRPLIKPLIVSYGVTGLQLCCRPYPCQPAPGHQEAQLRYEVQGQAMMIMAVLAGLRVNLATDFLRFGLSWTKHGGVTLDCAASSPAATPNLGNAGVEEDVGEQRQ